MALRIFSMPRPQPAARAAPARVARGLYAPGTPVDGRDGPIGTLQGIREDPATRQPAYLLVKRPGLFGLFGTTRLVPAAWVASATPDGITLAADRELVGRCPPARADGDIRDDVVRAIAAEPIMRPFHLGVRVHVAGGIVELRGHARTPMHRHLAERAARSVPGVLEVRNRLVDDESLALEVAQVLTQDPVVRRAHLRVDSRLGEVTLEGQLPSEAAWQQATELARAVPGVKAVRSLARVAPVAPVGPVPPETTA